MRDVRKRGTEEMLLISVKKFTALLIIKPVIARSLDVFIIFEFSHWYLQTSVNKLKCCIELAITKSYHLLWKWISNSHSDLFSYINPRLSLNKGLCIKIYRTSIVHFWFLFKLDIYEIYDHKVQIPQITSSIRCRNVWRVHIQICFFLVNILCGNQGWE